MRADQQQTSPMVRRRRTLAVSLLVLAGCVNYFDRSAVAIGNPAIRASLHLSYAQMGLLLSAFAWAYGLAQLPAGALIDKFGPRRALGAGLVLWSAAQISATFVTGLGPFIAARVALGLGESPMYIGGTRVCADWYRLSQRALPIAIFNASSALAPALAPPLLTVLMLAFGWRIMFLIAGLAGLVVAVLWLLFYRAPEEAGVPVAEIAQLRSEDPADTAEGSRILWLLQFRTTWAMFFGFFGVVYISWLYATWLPGYLETQRHLSVASAGLWSAVPMVAGFIGAVAGGFFARALGRIMAPGPACLAPIVAGMVLAGVCTIAAALTSGMGPAIALMSAGLFGANVASSCGWALAALIAPNRSVATLEAVQNIGGSLGGTLAPFITGLVVQSTGSFVPGFMLGGAIALASAVIYGLWARQPLGVLANVPAAAQ